MKEMEDKLKYFEVKWFRIGISNMGRPWMEEEMKGRSAGW